MALYFYQAFSKEGKKLKGYIDAQSKQNVREQLAKEGIFPTSIESVISENAAPWYKRLFQRKISLKDKIFFTKQFGVLLRAGVPLLQSLELLSDQTEGRLKSIVISLRDSIKEGKSLAVAMEEFPGVFDNIYIQLVKAGEASGKLEVILERLTDFMVRQEELRGKVRGALMYPAIQLAVVFLVVALLVVFVVPQITESFSKEGFTLPLTTRILTAISSFVINSYIMLIGSIALLASVFLVWSRSASGRYTLDKIKLKLPVIGYFTRMGAIVQFCRTLGMLLEGGVNLSESLNIVTQIVDNQVLVQALNKAKENIIKQGKIAQYLKQTEIFPPLAIYLINTGEQSGQLDAMLLAVAKQYEGELEEYADTLASILSPVILLIMGVIVGFIVVAIASPLLKMGEMAEKVAGRI